MSEQFLKSQIILFSLHQYFSYQLPVQTSMVWLLHLFCLDFWWEHGGKVHSILKTQPSSEELYKGPCLSMPGLCASPGSVNLLGQLLLFPVPPTPQDLPPCRKPLLGPVKTYSPCPTNPSHHTLVFLKFHALARRIPAWTSVPRASSPTAQ